MRWLMMLSSATSTASGAIFGATGAGLGALGGGCPASAGTLNVNVLPRPSSLSNATSPPIIATSRDEIARPSPVPP